MKIIFLHALQGGSTIGNSEGKANIFKGKYEATLDFPEGVGVQTKKTSLGEYEYFLEQHIFSVCLSLLILHFIKLILK